MTSERSVSVVGAGVMGSAIARALLAAGQAVTVWNRTAAKLEPLRGAGAAIADSFAQALGSSRVTVMCVSDQAAVGELMDMPGAAETLRGRTLVQFTTGTAADGRTGRALAGERGIRYLSAALLAYPRSVGTPAAVILCAGEEADFHQCQPVLSALGTVRYLGDDAGRPGAIDAALIAFFYGTLAGFLHGAVLAHREGIEAEEFLGLARPYLRGFIVDAVEETGARMLNRDYSNPQSSMRTHLGGIDKLVIASSQDARVEHEIMSAIKSVFLRAIEEGRGEEDIASLVEILTKG